MNKGYIHEENKEHPLRQWQIIGVGSGWGAQDIRTADGPKVLTSRIPSHFQNFPKALTYWHKIPLTKKDIEIHNENIYAMTKELSEQTKNTILQGKLPLVLGGDHSIAIGTWSGIKVALGSEDLGLIWIDAHLDAHTPKTSPSLNMHGMPVAVLLGQGESRFTTLSGPSPKLKPENIFLIGIRSFEKEEEHFLKEMGVTIYDMKEIEARGFHAIFQEVLTKFSNLKFGISIDVDAFDPNEAPGTGTPESQGLKFKNVHVSLYNLIQNPNFIALEITEFNPHRDEDHKTADLVWNLARTISGDLE